MSEIPKIELRPLGEAGSVCEGDVCDVPAIRAEQELTVPHVSGV